MNAIREGYKTTEFWLTLAALIVNGLSIFKVITFYDIDQTMKYVQMIVSGIVGIVAIGTYNHGRAEIKKAMIENGYETVVEETPAIEVAETTTTPVTKSDNSGL